MAKILKFILILIVAEILGWFALEGLLWIEFHVRLYTHFGRVLMTWGQHAIMIIILGVLSWVAVDK